MADGLYLPDGSFQPFSALELSTELATRQNAGVFYWELEGRLNTLDYVGIKINGFDLRGWV